MAALSATELTPVGGLPIGNKLLKTFRVAIANAAAADEWIATGLGNIEAVVGAVAIGTAADTGNLNVRKNAQGTGVAEDTNRGDLALEAAAATTYEVTVLGTP